MSEIEGEFNIMLASCRCSGIPGYVSFADRIEKYVKGMSKDE